MKAKIQQRLTNLEAEYGFRIVYANESGSRAWGFAAADSDYDVRFISASLAEIGDRVGELESRVPPTEDLDALFRRALDPS